MKTPVISLQAVTAGYAKEEEAINVLEDLTLEVNVGERLVIAGPNGSGKSTVLRVIVRDEKVYIHKGSVVTTANENHSAAIAYVPQNVDEGLFLGLSVIDNLTLALNNDSNIFKNWSRFPFYNSVKMFVAQRIPGLEPFLSHGIVELSGGWKAVVALAMAMIREPAVILLDEVTAHLDSRNKEFVVKSLSQFLKAESGPKYTFVMVMHNLFDAARLADRIVFLKDGQICATVDKDDIERRGVRQIVSEYDDICWGPLGDK